MVYKIYYVINKKYIEYIEFFTIKIVLITSIWYVKVFINILFTKKYCLNKNPKISYQIINTKPSISLNNTFLYKLTKKFINITLKQWELENIKAKLKNKIIISFTIDNL